MPAPMVSHVQKHYAAYCFNHLDLMNAVVLLTVVLASHDADAIVNSVKND